MLVSKKKSKAVPLHAMEALGGRGGIAPTHSRPRTRWRWVVSITPRPRFTPKERTPGTHCTGGWVGPRAGMDTQVRGNILCPRRGSNPVHPVVQPVVRHYTAWANPAPFLYVGTICYCPRCSSSGKECMATGSDICLKEGSGEFSAADGVTCELHLATLLPYIVPFQSGGLVFIRHTAYSCTNSWRVLGKRWKERRKEFARMSPNAFCRPIHCCIKYYRIAA
jgi:hypothetical protein